MGVVTLINSQEYFNQFNNGDDFTLNTSDITTNLVGNVGEKIKVVTELEVEWFSEASASDVWEVESDRIIRNSGNFRNDGFYIGHNFQYISDWKNTATNEFTANVTVISEDGKTLFFDTVVGVIPTGTGIVLDAIRARSASSNNFLTALVYKFGLIGNDESVNYNSKVTEEPQSYYAAGIGTFSGTRSTSFVDMAATGILNSWVTGTAKARYVSETTYTQVFEIEHEFIITPFFVDGQLTNIQNGTPPELFEGDETLKYVFDTQLRLELSNPNSTVSALSNVTLGSVGWFNENFDGFDNNYTIDSIVYEDVATTDSVDGLQLGSKTKATINVSYDLGSLAAGQRVGVMVSFLPSESEYTETISTLQDNFLYDILYHNEGDAAEVGTGIIKSLDSSISAGVLIIEAEIEYTALQIANLTDESNYLISVIIADGSLSSGNSDKVNLIADVSTYIEGGDIAGLLNFTQFNILQTNDVLGVDTGYTDAENANQDAVVIDSTFDIDLALDAVLNTLSFKLLAYNTVSGAYFELDSFDFDLSNAPIISGVQQINILSNRGYKLEETNQFNIAYLEVSTRVGDLQEYTLKIAQKFRWETWIRNNNVDDVFFDAAEPNDNFNFKSSNYSGLENYEIKLAVLANLSGTDDIGRIGDTDYLVLSPNIPIFNYEDTSIIGVPMTISLDTFTTDESQSLSGGVLQSEDTLIRADFEATALSVGNSFSTIRIQKSNDLGGNIYELKSNVSDTAFNILKGVDDELLLTVTQESENTISAKALIDYTRIEQGVNYNINAVTRFLSDPMLMQIDTTNTSTGSTLSTQYKLPLVSTGIYNFTVFWGDGSFDVITTWNQAEVTHTYAASGIKDIVIEGTLQGWSQGNTGDRNKLLEISRFGKFKLSGTTTTNGHFHGCNNVVFTATDTPDMGGTTSLTNSFNGCSSTVLIPNIELWGFGSITSYLLTFANCTLLNEPGLSNIATSAATTISSMYFNCGALNQSFANYNMTNVLNASFAFTSCTSLNQSFIGTFSSTCGNVTTFSATWQGCTSLNQSFAGLQTGSATTFASMYKNCTSLDQNFASFDVTSLLGANFMFDNVTLSTANYDALLVGWEAQAVNDNVVFVAGNSTYTAAGAGGTARAALIADHTWSITDGGGI